MYVLIGVREAHYPEETDEENKVAVFSTEKEAEDYENKARLSTFSRWCGRGQHGCKQYRAKSLLRDFCRAYVEWYEEEDLPVNPVIEK